MPDPIDLIEWRSATELRANDWNPNRVFRPELRLLERSLVTIGWIQPLLVNPTGLLIDGFHRWRLSIEDGPVQAKYGGLAPVAVLDVPDDVAMAVTVRINRAKGAHAAVEMHKLVHRLLTEHAWSRERVALEIGASLHEVDTLARDGVFAAKNTAAHAYSSAWYPVEAASMEEANE